MSLGLLLARRRADLDISQKDLAKQVGISSAYLSDIETGRRNVRNLITLNRFAEHLKLPFYVLVLHLDSKVPIRSKTDLGETQRWALFIRSELEAISNDIASGTSANETRLALERLSFLLAAPGDYAYVDPMLIPTFAPRSPHG